MQKVTSRTFDIVFMLFLMALVIFVAIKHQAIRDWWTLRNYEPSAAIEQLAKDDNLTTTGQHYFYLGHPELVDHATMQKVCGSDIVGCTDEHDHIYLLKEDKPSDHNEVMVTAAHEMLHMAWRRLSKIEQTKIGKLVVQDALNQPGDVKKEASRIGDTPELVDEEHSLLGTEYEHLSPDLEAYYQRYFIDRQAILQAYGRSQSP